MPASMLVWLREPLVIRGLISAVAVLFASLGAILSGRLLSRRIAVLEARYRARKGAVYLWTLAAVLALVIIWLPYLGQVGWALGLLGAGLALALAGPIACLAGWLYIVVRRPFDVGDRIQVGDVRGDVIDIQAFHSTLIEVGGWVRGEQSTGRMAFLPNQRVFTEVLHNYTKGFPFLWNELTIVVTFESDWRRAKAIMVEHAQHDAERVAAVARRLMERVSKRYAFRFGQLTPIVYSRIAENGVELTLRYLVEVRQRRGTESALAEAILDGIAREPTVALAYPTQRLVGIPRPGGPPPIPPLEEATP